MDFKDKKVMGDPVSEVPDVVKNEVDDKPAARGIYYAIAIAILVLLIVYFIM